MGNVTMTLDELAKLVRKTAKELNLTLDKICVFHGDRTMDFRAKQPKSADPRSWKPHVYCELVNGMKVGRVRLIPGMLENDVESELAKTALAIGLTMEKK